MGGAEQGVSKSGRLDCKEEEEEEDEEDEEEEEEEGKEGKGSVDVCE